MHKRMFHSEITLDYTLNKCISPAKDIELHLKRLYELEMTQSQRNSYKESLELTLIYAENTEMTLQFGKIML